MIHTILSKRNGIPITLAVIYSAIVRRATGLQLQAVNLPGHFMISANADDAQESEQLFVDAFHSGKIMSESEVASMITASYNIRWNQNYLSTVPNTMVWKRIAMNLMNSFDLPNELYGPVTSLIAMGFNHNGVYDIRGENRLLLLI
jgi:regulator of sirC expression with transglutaminase-like and TPR domain